MTTISISDILCAVGSISAITAEQITGQSRLPKIIPMRQAAMWLAREMTGKSLPLIGERFGDRHHTTVLHNVSGAEKRMLTDENYRATLIGLRQSLAATSGWRGRFRAEKEAAESVAAAIAGYFGGFHGK